MCTLSGRKATPQPLLWFSFFKKINFFLLSGLSRISCSKNQIIISQYLHKIMLSKMWRNGYGECNTVMCLLKNNRPKRPEWVLKDIQWFFPSLNYSTVIFSTSWGLCNMSSLLPLDKGFIRHVCDLILKP